MSSARQAVRRAEILMPWGYIPLFMPRHHVVRLTGIIAGVLEATSPSISRSDIKPVLGKLDIFI